MIPIGHVAVAVAVAVLSSKPGNPPGEEGAHFSKKTEARLRPTGQHVTMSRHVMMSQHVTMSRHITMSQHVTMS